MSLMGLIFEALAWASDERQAVRLSGALIDELFSYCICGGLAVVNLRAATLPMMRASDSSGWMAAVGCDLPLPVAREAIRLYCRGQVGASCCPPGKLGFVKRSSWRRKKRWQMVSALTLIRCGRLWADAMSSKSCGVDLMIGRFT